MVMTLIVILAGINVFKDTINPLLGLAPDKALIDDIENFIMSYDKPLGIHDLMMHDYGPGRKIVSFHAEVPADADICKAHDIIDELEQDMLEKFKCITTIHMDPIVVNDEKISNTKKVVERIVREYNEEYSIHDFRMTDGGKRINLIFDLAIPRKDNRDHELIEKEITEKIREVNQSYRVVMRVEHLFV